MFTTIGKKRRAPGIRRRRNFKKKRTQDSRFEQPGAQLAWRKTDNVGEGVFETECGSKEIKKSPPSTNVNF